MEIPILLLGTDTTGKVFSEETKTVVLSRHGAGIVSQFAFAPDEVLTLRLPGSENVAEIRMVGQIGGEPGRYVYGVTFVDPDPHFWPVEFPPPESFELASPRIPLECSLCRARQNVEQHEIEEDVYSVNGNVLRYCARCGASTPWTKSPSEPFPFPTEALSRTIPTRLLPRSSTLSNQLFLLLSPLPRRRVPHFGQLFYLAKPLPHTLQMICCPSRNRSVFPLRPQRRALLLCSRHPNR